MRRKILQDHANTLCQMLVGWRMGDDLDVLSELPDGILFIDVVAGKATHSVAGLLDLHIASELHAWFFHRLQISNIQSNKIYTATVQANINTNRIATNRKKVVSFDFAVQAKIDTDETSYIGQTNEVHHWHQRLPSNKSFKRSR